MPRGVGIFLKQNASTGVYKSSDQSSKSFSLLWKTESEKLIGKVFLSTVIRVARFWAAAELEASWKSAPLRW